MWTILKVRGRDCPQRGSSPIRRSNDGRSGASRASPSLAWLVVRGRSRAIGNRRPMLPSAPKNFISSPSPVPAPAKVVRASLSDLRRQFVRRSSLDLPS